MAKVVDADNIRYTRDHEWVMMEEATATLGVTDYAQSELPDINFVELPAEGLEVNAGDEVVAIESTRDSAAVLSPLDGTVVEVNTLLEENPELLNSDPYGDGWLIRLEMTDVTTWQDLLTAEEYEEYVGD
jgi:glycine cleavage system H protein